MLNVKKKMEHMKYEVDLNRGYKKASFYMLILGFWPQYY